MPTDNNFLVRIELPAIRTSYVERNAGYVIARLYYNRRYAEWYWYLVGRSASYVTWQGVSNVNAYPGRRLSSRTSQSTPSNHMKLALRECLGNLHPLIVEPDPNVFADWERDLLYSDYDDYL